MEVTLLSSGAISRAHYNLVLKLEASPSHRVDNLLYVQVETLQRRLAKQHSTSSDCMEVLVLLLYCVTVSLGRVTRARLNFAVPYAISLAETGSNIQQKRIGYIFCNEIMGQNDDLQIMLVNTLRKFQDLEDTRVARICLALDALVTNCPSDAIPAVTPRLVDLLAHDSPHVKRKTIAVLRRIGPQCLSALSYVKDKIRLRLRDSDSTVVGSALRLLGTLTQHRAIAPEDAFECAFAFGGLIQDDSSPSRYIEYYSGSKVTLTGFLGCLAKESGSPDQISLLPTRVIEILHELLIQGKESVKNTALVLEVVRALSSCSTEMLIPYFSSRGATAKTVLGKLIKSPKPNVQYACLACLLLLDPTCWAGTTDLVPATFDESEVYIIMRLLDCPDTLIRRKTLRVLNRVDPQILSLHLSQLQSVARSSSSLERTSIAERAVDVAAELDADGEVYMSHLKEILIPLESGPRVGEKIMRKGKGKKTDGGASLVHESLVEQVLVHLRTRSTDFCRGFIDATARIPSSDSGPTFTLIIAAAVCEYGALSSILQEDLLRGLAGRLSSNPPAIQEALLLAMLRVTSRCDLALPEVTDQVRTLYKVSGSHIRHRCDQYLSFSGDMTLLKRIATLAESDTLPDFIYALENAEKESDPTQQYIPKPSNVDPPSSIARGKLRYEAYDPPRLAPKLTRRPSSTASVDSHPTSSSSDRHDSTSPYSHFQNEFKPRSSGSGDSEDSLSRTLTAGDLALLAHGAKFPVSNSPILQGSLYGGSQTKSPSSAGSPLIEDITLKTDLITLDSPFLTMPTDVPARRDPGDFSGLWDSLKDNTTLRGWCETGIKEVEQRVKKLSNYHITTISQDVPAKNGELLLGIGELATGISDEMQAAVRLIPGDDNSTLWQMRSLDTTLKTKLRTLLNDT